MAKLQGRAPEPDQALEGAAPPIKEVANSRFLLQAHPQAWSIVHASDGPHVIPRFGRVPRRAGVALVRRNGDMTLALANARARGWTVIPEDVQGPGTSYLRGYDLPGGKTYWCTEWEERYAGAAASTADLDGLVSFAEMLISQGVIEPCPDYVLAGMRSRLDGQLQDAMDRATHIPSYKALVTRLEADLACIDAEIKGRSEEPVKARKAAPSKAG